MRLAFPIAVLAALATGLLVPSPASAATPHTHRVVVRPVDAHGHPVAGWSVHRERDLTVSCSEGSSPAAVDDGIAFCGPSAAYTPACWK